MIQGYTPDGYVFTADYDAEDRMTSLEYIDSSSVVHRTEYSYSGDGFLAVIRKFENSSLVDEIRIVRDGFLAVQERDENNAVEREYTWGLNLGGGIGGLLNLKQGGQDYAYLYDGKGNIAAVLDASQSVVAAYRYAPFGKLLAKTGSLTQSFGFSTKRYDEQTGLLHYQYRPYAPSIGRWTTRDPLGEAGGINLYAFVGNSPVNWVDPWGLVLSNSEGNPLIDQHLAILAADSPTAAQLIDLIRQSALQVKILIRPYEIDHFNDGTFEIHYTGAGDTLVTGTWSPAEIILAHELIHSWYHINKDTCHIDTYSREEQQDIAIGRGRYSDFTFTENRIRDEFGLPPRPSVPWYIKFFFWLQRQIAE